MTQIFETIQTFTMCHGNINIKDFGKVGRGAQEYNIVITFNALLLPLQSCLLGNPLLDGQR